MSYRPPNKATIYTANNVGSDDVPMRIWAGEVTSGTNGSWTLDVSSAGFNKILSVVATAQADQATITNIPVATIKNFTAARVTGWVIRPATGGILLGGAWTGAAFSSTPTRVFVQVVGQ